MHCKHCGSALSDNTRFCTSCGGQQTSSQPDSDPTATNGGTIGYSRRINDPAFAGYLKNNNRWSAIFSGVLAVTAVVGFTLAGELGIDNLENPQALFIGLGIGGMFLAIGIYTIISRKKSKTWDGIVVDKTIKKKTRRQGTGGDDNDYYIDHYTEYRVIVRDQSGKTHRLTAEDDDTQYNYYQVGDHVRHHEGLNSYEKYDKSKDSIIFCNACATLCDIKDDLCFRCKCPLLK
jgi:hypothetical protein